MLDNYQGINTDYLVFTGTGSLLLASVISLPLLPGASFLYALYWLALVVCTLALPLLMLVSRVRFFRNRKGYLPVFIAGAGVIAVLAIYLFLPDLMHNILDKLDTLFSTTGNEYMAIAETQPLLTQLGNFSFATVWTYFTTSFFISIIALVILIIGLFKRNIPERNLLVIWSLLILAAALGQRRISHYLVVNIALLTGLAAWRVLSLDSIARAFTRVTDTIKKPKRKYRQRKQQRPANSGILWRRIAACAGIAVILFVVYVPNIGVAVYAAQQPRNVPSDAWCASLDWLKENSPEPFGNADYYYQLYELPGDDGHAEYPESAYSVMAWADYGHWINRIAHRISVVSPFQWGVDKVSIIFTSQDSTRVNNIITEHDVRYIMIDSNTMSMLSGMYDIANWEDDRLYETYYMELGDEIIPVQMYYPAYYRTLAVRLYLFDAGAIEAENTMVISYYEQRDPNGKAYKFIDKIFPFSSYGEALEYVSGQTEGNYNIVSNDPFSSPVSLEPLSEYRLVYQSEEFVYISSSSSSNYAGTESTGEKGAASEASIPAVKIFEISR